jgi:hypothetical protein
VSADRITAIRVVQLDRPAAGVIIRPDGTFGMAYGKVAVVMGVKAGSIAYRVAEQNCTSRSKREGPLEVLVLWHVSWRWSGPRVCPAAFG